MMIVASMEKERSLKAELRRVKSDLRNAKAKVAQMKGRGGAASEVRKGGEEQLGEVLIQY
jgi:hypothetical protein